MNEKEIRERIERFLKKTARTLVVPASVGLSLSGCDSHALGGGQADAGRDAAAQGAEVADAATSPDLPQIYPPYLVVMMPDAGTDPGPLDSGADTQPRPEAGPEIPSPPPPYLIVADVPPLAPGRGAPLPLVPKKNG